MSEQDDFFNQPLFSHRRRTNPDGSNNIACKRCGRIIAASVRERMVTAICHECATGQVQPKQVPIVDGVPRPDLMQESQNELLDAIFYEQGTLEKQIQKSRRVWSPFDLIAGGFKALGFSQHRKAEQPKDVVYDMPEQESSRQIAKRKARTPIFGKKEEK